MEYRITIPEIPPSLNEILRWHWTFRSKEKKRWAEMIWYCIKSQKIQYISGKVKIKAVYYFNTKRNRDYDNFAGAFKFIGDGLKGIVIEDDNSNIITELSFQFEYSKENPRTEIVIKGGG